MNKATLDQSYSVDIEHTDFLPSAEKNNASLLLDPVFPSSQTQHQHLNPAQKRQNSMSAYANNPSSKRTANPLQMQLPLQQSNVPGAQPYPNPPAQSFSNPGFAARLNAPPRKSTRKTNQLPALASQNQFFFKTPTPSHYDVPSSPNVTTATVQNNSDLSASSPAVDTASLVPPSSSESQIHSVNTQPSSASSQRALTDEEQHLAIKLKDTYKSIVNLEEVVQKSCIDLTLKINHTTYANPNSSFQMSMYGMLMQGPAGHTPIPANSTELSNDLWTIYHHNVTLLNNYYDFLITALKPTAYTTNLKTGKNIVDVYKIPRRMWVYGIVGFLEVLKNIMSVFQDHEIFLCFIAYCFSIVSNLTDPALEMEGWWCEKLGDLSRMAIALYSTRYIDWKISAEYWYAVAMKTMYGHGKIYYHMCTLQQDNLDALVNIGKSVTCRDPFVPTQQYLRLVVENICTQRNILSLLELPIIDFVKIHKVLLSVHSSQNRVPIKNDATSQVENIHDAQLQYGIDLVTRYGLTFGCDSHGYNFFTRIFCIPSGFQNKYSSDQFSLYLKQQHEQDQQANTLDTIEKMNFWLEKGALFAISNVNHLIGFGDPRNPFAKIFLLPEALKERKDKKDRKRKSKPQNSQDEGVSDIPAMLSGNLTELGAPDSPIVLASELSLIDWFYCLNSVNKSVLELSFRILNYYLIGPKQASTCHVIIWLYFLIAVGKSTDRFPKSKNMFMWLFRKLFPWENLINYLNTLLAVARNNEELSTLCRHHITQHPDYLEYFNQQETLSEVWKCWGSLWFDVIAPKHDYNDSASAGIYDQNLFDAPNCGVTPEFNAAPQTKPRRKNNDEYRNDERLVRILLLARLIADKFDFGLVRTREGFKFDERIYNETKSNKLISATAPGQANELFTFVRNVMFNDARLVQNQFVVPISPENLYSAKSMDYISWQTKDEQWFGVDKPRTAGDVGKDDDDLDMISQHHSPDMTDSSRDPNYFETSVGSNQNPKNYALLEDFIKDLDSSEMPNITGSELVEGDLGEYMDTSLTYVTLDTNIWLKHCGRIFKCVRSKILKVLIPLIVFQELRSLRKSTEATISDAATRSVIIIRELYMTKEIVPLRYDGTVASDINETTEFEHNSNWMSAVDLTMLNVVSEHDEISKKLMKGLNATINGPKPVILDSKTSKLFRYCILITDDRNMRLRAKTSGLSGFQSKWLFGQLESIFPDKCID